jgi:hypothetical protein
LRLKASREAEAAHAGAIADLFQREVERVSGVR